MPPTRPPRATSPSATSPSNDITGALGKNASGILGGKNSTGNEPGRRPAQQARQGDPEQARGRPERARERQQLLGPVPAPARRRSSASAAPTPPGGAGAAVTAVKAGSPAADAGLQAGDVITAVDGKAVINSAALATQVQAHSAGDVVIITYSRTARAPRHVCGSATRARRPPTRPPRPPRRPFERELKSVPRRVPLTRCKVRDTHSS